MFQHRTQYNPWNHNIDAKKSVPKMTSTTAGCFWARWPNVRFPCIQYTCLLNFVEVHPLRATSVWTYHPSTPASEMQALKDTARPTVPRATNSAFAWRLLCFKCSNEDIPRLPTLTITTPFKGRNWGTKRALAPEIYVYHQSKTLSLKMVVCSGKCLG